MRRRLFRWEGTPAKLLNQSTGRPVEAPALSHINGEKEGSFV